MKINPKLICMSIVFTFLVVMASNVAAADTIEAGKLTKVASNVASDSNPVWSPNGKEILFAKGAGNYGANLYKVFSDGSGEKKLASDTYGGYAWSPDGSKISYYQIIDEVGSYDLSLMNADGTKKTQLLNPVSNLFFYIYSWFPSSSKIAYVSGVDNLGSLYEINSDGSNNHEIGVNVNGAIAVSPDESKILCTNWDWEYPEEIYVHSLNQNSGYYLTDGSISPQTQSWQPEVWSPDGKKIVYNSDENGNSDIYTIKTDGTGKTQLTSDSANDENPIFSPDGKKIVYLSDKNGNEDIWVMDTDGKNKVQLTTDSATDSHPEWSPDGKKIAFYSERRGDLGIYTLTLENGNKPIADFSASPTSGNAPLKVKFTDKSSNSPTNWKWNFGDGKTSTVKNPVYTYSKAGKYTISLTVKNAAGTITKTIKNYITVKTAPVKPVASFSASPTSGNAPLKVQFIDKSANTPTSWKWSFGDGKTSTVKNPAYTYSKAGKYTVSLTVKNAAGSNTKTISGYIKTSKK